MKMKKLLVGAFLGLFTLAGITLLPNSVSADSGEGYGHEGFGDSAGRGGQNTSYNASVAGSKNLQKDSLIHTIRTAINWVLGILSLIALILCLYAGFLMMTSGGDSKKYEKGVGIMKWAGIGLAVIALSWLIVSLIFWLIGGSVGDTVAGEAKGTEVP